MIYDILLMACKSMDHSREPIYSPKTPENWNTTVIPQITEIVKDI